MSTRDLGAMPYARATFEYRARVARKRHVCTGCEGAIQPGESYLYWRGVYPEHGPGVLTHKECARCATRYGRDDLLAAPVSPVTNQPKEGPRGS